MDYCSIINSLESFRIPRSIEDPSISQIFRWWDLLPPVRHTWPRYIESSVVRQSKGSMLRTSVGRDSRKSPSLSDAKHHQCVVTCFSCFEMRISNIVLVLSESKYVYMHAIMLENLGDFLASHVRLECSSKFSHYFAKIWRQKSPFWIHEKVIQPQGSFSGTFLRSSHFWVFSSKTNMKIHETWKSPPLKEKYHLPKPSWFLGESFSPWLFSREGGGSRRSPNLDIRNCDLVYWDHIFLGFPHDFHIQMSQSKLNGCVFSQQEMAHCGRCSERTHPHQLGFTHDDSSA